MSVNKSIYGNQFRLDFKLDPPVSEWKIASKKEEGSFVREKYKDKDYLLALEEQRNKDYTIVEFNLKRESGEPFNIQQYTLTGLTTNRDMHRIWIPYPMGSTTGAPVYVAMPRNLRVITAAEQGIPIAFAMNRAGMVKLALGFINQKIETDVRIDNQNQPHEIPRGIVLLELKRPLDGYVLGPVKEHRDAFFTCKDYFWFDAMQKYSKVHAVQMKQPVKPSPDTAWEPLWANFHAYPAGEFDWGHYHNLDEKLLLQELKIAAELGLKTLIFEPSWFSKTKEEWMSEFGKSGRSFHWGWPDNCGDYVAHPRFSDFVGMIRKIRRMGLRTLLWVQPFAAGIETSAREKLKDALVETSPSSFHHFLCPRNPVTQKHGVEVVTRLLRDYEVDGFKVDCMNDWPLTPCRAKHAHVFSSVGIAIDHCIAQMKQAIDSVKPDAVIEFSHLYANINCLNYASAFRATDSAELGDFDQDRRLCVLLRSYIPPGVAVYNDPMWWRPDEDDKTVAKMLSTQVVSGVPEIVTNLIDMPDNQRALLKRWLDFYQEHKEDFRHGQLRPIQNDPQFSTILVESGRKAFVSYANYPALRVPLEEEVEEIYLFNCTNADNLYTILHNVSREFSAEVRDPFHSSIAEKTLRAKNGMLTVDLNVPQGGYSILKKAS